MKRKFSSDFGAAGHFKAGSALREFMAGRLGFPGYWPNESDQKLVPVRVSEKEISIQRWETEGGRTIAATAPSKNHSAAPSPRSRSHRRVFIPLI